jgi:hypothetical protein
MQIKSRVPTDLDRVGAVEGAVREYVRQKSAPRRSLEDGEVVANNMNTFLERVAGFSIAEIDRIIAELHSLRDVLQSKGERVQREIAEYSHLTQSAIQSTKIITEALAGANLGDAARPGG